VAYFLADPVESSPPSTSDLISSLRPIRVKYSSHVLRSDRSQPRLTASLHSALSSNEMRSGEMRWKWWDEMRWDEMRTRLAVRLPRKSVSAYTAYTYCTFTRRGSSTSTCSFRHKTDTYSPNFHSRCPRHYTLHKSRSGPAGDLVPDLQNILRLSYDNAIITIDFLIGMNTWFTSKL